MRHRLLGLLAGAAVVVAGGVLPAGTGHHTAEATIHELVSSRCAFDRQGNRDPHGQSRPGTQSFLRALLASGVYTGLVIGEDPDGNEGAFVTVDVDFDHPASKVTWDGETYDTFESPLGTVFLPDGERDHPSFEHCRELNP